MSEQEIRERFGEALARLDDDIDLLCQMAALTAPDCATVIEGIRQSLSSGDRERAVQTLHKLKGMLSTFDSDGIVLDLQEMIDLARRDKLMEVSHSFQKREAEIQQTIATISHLANSSTQSTG